MSLRALRRVNRGILKVIEGIYRFIDQNKDATAI